VAWMEDLARQGQRSVIYFDDIEKFGIWPETYNWVYERGWLAKFIEGVLASKLIRTQTYAEYHAANATRGIVYLPTTSYIEMNEWSLPGPAARTYHALVESEKKQEHFEAHKPFLRGGIWRNFFSRYPESNWMHKRSLEASERYAALAPSLKTEELQELLHRSQANDAFWHGLFGGLYLPHLRRAIWNNLLMLEARLDAIAPRVPLVSVDRDVDGYAEVFTADRSMLAVIRPDGDASVVELSSYTLSHNFGDTLRRYEEGYHARVIAAEQSSSHAAAGDGIASAHDRITFKDVITAEDVVPDARPRGLFVDTWLADDDTAIVPNYFANGPLSYSAAGDEVRLRKNYTLDGSGFKASYLASDSGVLQTEINLAMPSCDGYAGRYMLADGSVPCGFGQELDIDNATRLSLIDGVLGGKLILTSNFPVSISGRPHFTVSQSEAGFEKIMQAATLTLRWQARTEQTLEITLTAESGE
jgi:4-alpha-glucanotransferase